MGVDDDFYALGGDSLAAMHLQARVAEALGKPPSPVAFAARPTVRGLVEGLAASDGGRAASDGGLDGGAEVRPHLTLSQEGLWVRHRLDPAATGDHLPAVLRLRGPLDEAALRRAFAAVLARHEALRAVVEERDGRPAPRVLPVDDPRLALPPAQALAALQAQGPPLQARVRDALAPPFHLDQGPPWRARLLRVGPDHHLLLLVFHHLAVDAEALALLVDELAALLDDRAPPAPASPWARAHQERSHLARGAFEPSLRWWAQALRDSPAFSGLPPDLPAPAPAPHAQGPSTPVGALRPLHLPAERVRSLEARARPLGLTPFQALLTALGRALQGLGAGERLRIATPVARGGDADGPCLGFFANTVVVPLPWLPGLPAELALRLCRDAVRGALAHADAPFPLVLARVDPPRDPAHSPLFQVVLALQAPLPRRRTAAGLTLSLEELQAPTAPFALTVELWPEEDGSLRGAVLYDARLYSPARVDALAQRLQAELVELARPAAPAAAPPPSWVRGPPLPPPAPETDLPAALRRTAERHGDHALRFVEDDDDEQVLTYAELWGQAVAVARGLAALGLRAGDRVVLQQPRLADHTTHLWACLLLGAVPLSVAVPPDPAARTPASDKLALLVARLGTAGPEGRPGAAVLAPPDLALALSRLLLTGTRVLSPSPDPGPPPPPSPGPVAFLQASSGSTGRVKLVPQTHAAVLAHVRAATAHCGYGPEDRTLSWLPFDHVASLLMCHLKDTVVGAHQVHLRTGSVLADPLRLLDRIHRHRVTHTLSPDFGLALVAQALQDRPHVGEQRGWDLSCLRRIANGAETVKPATTRAFLARTACFGLDPAAMQPGFGMAETASVVCFHNRFDLDRDLRWVRRDGPQGRPERVDAPGPGVVPVVSLGGPLPGVELRIVDEADQTLPQGQVGRLLVRGAVVFEGYLDAEPGGPAPDGWFDTGDLGLVEQGQLSLVGRARETIVVRGAKVQAEEVEAALAELPGLAAGGVAAVALPEGPGEGGGEGEGETLGLFLVPRPGADEAALERTARTRLGEALGLSVGVLRIVGAHDLPRTGARKLQRPALAARYRAGAFPDLPPLAVRERRWQPAPLPASLPGGPPGDGPVTLVGGDAALRRALERALGRPLVAAEDPGAVRILVPPAGAPGAALGALLPALLAADEGRAIVAGGQ
ncbi:AMP-binding protein, partial [Myxococcota bacterium]|nr:AMP-binding protein [Myxococcota bacterium]